MSTTFAFIITLFVGFFIDDAVSRKSINGTGSTVMLPVINQAILGYGLERDSVTITFNPTSSVLGQVAVLADPPFADFAVLESPADTQSQDLPNSSGLVLFPAAAFALVPVVHIPGIGSNQLILTGETLAKIYLGQIEYWDDSDIIQDNVDFNNTAISAILPHQLIRRVLPAGSQAVTQTFTSALQSMSTAWQNSGYGVLSAWTSTQTSQYTLSPTYAGSLRQLSASLYAQNYSIGYIPYPIVACYGLAAVRLVNRDGQVVAASTVTVASAQNQANLTEFLKNNFVVSLIDLPGNNTWPISTMEYVLAPNSSEYSCSQLRETVRFWYWILTQYSHHATVRLGYSILTPRFSTAVVTWMERLECDGKELLTYTASPLRDGRNYQQLLGLNIILGGIFLVVGVYMVVVAREHSALLFSYTVTLVTGAIMTYAAVGFWFVEPDSDWVCQGRIWTSTLGYTLLISAMSLRMWQLKRIFHRVYQGQQLLKSVKGWVELGGALVAVLVAQLVLLGAFQSAGYFQSTQVIVDQEEFLFKYDCTYSTVWGAFELTLFCLLIMWSLRVVYGTWNWEGMKIESKYLLIAIYNTIFIASILSILFYTKDGVDDDVMYKYVAWGTAFATTSIMSAVCVPYFVRRLMQTSNNPYRSKIFGETLPK